MALGDSGRPEDVLTFIPERADLIVPIANGEPRVLMDTIEAAAPSLSGVRVHQMHTLQGRRYLYGAFGDRLRHVSYFLSECTRAAYQEGHVDLVPNHFSEV